MASGCDLHAIIIAFELKEFGKFKPFLLDYDCVRDFVQDDLDAIAFGADIPSMLSDLNEDAKALLKDLS